MESVREREREGHTNTHRHTQLGCCHSNRFRCRVTPDTQANQSASNAAPTGPHRTGRSLRCANKPAQSRLEPMETTRGSRFHRGRRICVTFHLVIDLATALMEAAYVLTEGVCSHAVAHQHTEELQDTKKELMRHFSPPEDVRESTVVSFPSFIPK